ncbi:uncharacterized protein LOC141637320 [Silene latifolia]|uniref:uncharacterized protein LOC141637320 n=1 Tax=Silene latifolia TaxID=37657 RepID=UPI003D781256
MFVIPNATIKRVEAICRNFLWDSSSEYHRVPLVGWDRVTLPKDAGGLGIKKASIWNIAAVGKLVNWIYTKSDRLWIKWVDNVYLKGSNWHDYKPANDASWTWKSICKVKEKIKDGFIDNLWYPHQKGYTIGNGYDWLLGTHASQPWSVIVWNDWNIPKCSLNSWLIMQEGINTKAKLFAYGVCTDDRCILCETQTETSDHLFNYCDFGKQVHELIEEWIGRSIPTINELMITNRNNMKWKAMALIQTTYRYCVWTQRNRARHELCVERPVIVFERMKKMIRSQVRRKYPNRDGRSDFDAVGSLMRFLN